MNESTRFRHGPQNRENLSNLVPRPPLFLEILLGCLALSCLVLPFALLVLCLASCLDVTKIRQKTKIKDEFFLVPFLCSPLPPFLRTNQSIARFEATYSSIKYRQTLPRFRYGHPKNKRLQKVPCTVCNSNPQKSWVGRCNVVEKTLYLALTVASVVSRKDLIIESLLNL